MDEDGDVIDLLVQPRRNRRAAIRFFRKLLKGQGRTPRRLITDKLPSYGAACRTVMPSVRVLTPGRGFGTMLRFRRARATALCK